MVVVNRTAQNNAVSSPIGVDHGKDGGTPQNLELGIVPPDFVMLQNFKYQITCITM